jgi:hypothetical protein
VWRFKANRSRRTTLPASSTMHASTTSLVQANRGIYTVRGRK